MVDWDCLDAHHLYERWCSLLVSTLTIKPGVDVCIFLFRANLIDDRSMTLSPFLPALGVATAALVGGQIVTYAYDISPRLAVPVIIVAYLLAGPLIWPFIILYGVFFHRLMASGWPEPAKRPALMMLVRPREYIETPHHDKANMRSQVGPFGQTSAEMQVLGSAGLTKMDFAGCHKGTLLPC